MSNPNIDKLVEISKNGTKKKMEIEELLDTSQWVWDSEFEVEQGTSRFISDYDKYTNIIDPLLELKNKYVPVTKRLTHRFGKVWTVDEDVAKNKGLLEQAKFINSKAYILNKKIKSSFLFPELKRFQNNNIDLPMMLGGNLNRYSDNGELIALCNTILMSGGGVTLDAYKPFEKIHNGIMHQLQKGNLRLTEDEKDRLVLLLKKNAKYTERVVLVYEYLKKYNSLPEKPKKDKKVLKKIVDKYEKLNKKKRKVNKNILDHIKGIISGKSEEKSEYYTENVPTTFIHKMDLSHLSGERVGRLLLEKFDKREDREKTKKLILCREDIDELYNILNGMETQMGEYVRITRELEGLVQYLEKESIYWKGKFDISRERTDIWKDSAKFWMKKSYSWKGKSDSWKGKSDSWKEKFQTSFKEQMKLVKKLRETGASGTTKTVGDALGTLSGNVTLDTDLTIRINGIPLGELTPEKMVNFFRDDNLLRMLRDSEAGTRQQIQAILSTNFTPQQIRQLPAGILFMLGFPVPIRDLVADLDLSNMVRPAIGFATILRTKFEGIVRILKVISEQVDITDLERLTEVALRDLVSQMNSLTDETTSTQLVRSNGIIDVLINLFNIENASRQILNDIRGLLPDKPASQDIIKSLDNLLEDNGTADLRLAVTRIRGLLPAPPAPVVISPEVLEKLEKKGISSEEAKRRIRNMENPNFNDFDEEGKLSQKDMAIFNNFDVSEDDTIPVATVPVVRIEDAPAVVPSANIPNNKLVINLMDYLRESERQPVVTLSEEDKTKYKSDRSKYNSTKRDCKKCNKKHYLPVNCDKDGIKRKCVGYDVKDTTTRRTSNMNRDDRRKVVRAKIEKLTR